MTRRVGPQTFQRLTTHRWRGGAKVVSELVDPARPVEAERVIWHDEAHEGDERNSDRDPHELFVAQPTACYVFQVHTGSKTSSTTRPFQSQTHLAFGRVLTNRHSHLSPRLIGAFVLLGSMLLHASALAQQGSGSSPSAFLGVRLDRTSAGQVRLIAILPGSPASRSGLSRGDIVVEIGGRQIATTNDVITAVQSHSVGDQLQVVILREGQRRAVGVALGAAPANGQVLRSFVGHQAPAWRLPRADGAGNVELTSMRGRVVVLYFWSIWCGACRMATPNLERLEQSFARRGLSVVAVSDDPIAELQQAQSAAGLSFPLLHDVDTKVGVEYWVTAVPTIFVVDQQGRVAYVAEGWDQATGRAMEAEIQRLLGSSSP